MNQQEVSSDKPNCPGWQVKAVFYCRRVHSNFKNEIAWEGPTGKKSLF